MKVFFGVLFLTVCCRISEGKFAARKALVYLSQYGYLETNSMGNSSQVDAKTFRKSLKEFQAFAGIPVTGVIDKATEKVMRTPRCGIKDNLGSSNRSQNFVIQGSKWRTTHLTYRITKYPARLDRRSVDRTIQMAFGIWSKYTPLTFEPTTGRGNIDIRFEVGSHGDGDGFDGPGGTLAHAYFPQFGGATHFDDTEPWTIGGGRGTDLLQVATHEFGHALGLSHSNIREALMAPYYKSELRIVDLYRDDIEGIQRLYGQRNGRRFNPGRPAGPSYPRRPQFPGFPRFPSFPRFPRFPGYPRFPGFPSFPRYQNGFYWL